MTIPVSTIPAAAKALYALLESAFAGEPLTLVLGEPPTYLESDVVFIDGIDKRIVEPFAMVGSGGAGWLYEKYGLMVYISSFRGGGEDQMIVAIERAYQLLATVEQAVRGDPTIGGTVLLSYPSELSPDKWGYDEDHKGPLVEVVLIVHCEAQI